MGENLIISGLVPRMIEILIFEFLSCSARSFLTLQGSFDFSDSENNCSAMGVGLARIDTLNIRMFSISWPGQTQLDRVILVLIPTHNTAKKKERGYTERLRALLQEYLRVIKRLSRRQLYRWAVTSHFAGRNLNHADAPLSFSPIRPLCKPRNRVQCYGS